MNMSMMRCLVSSGAYYYYKTPLIPHCNNNNNNNKQLISSRPQNCSFTAPRILPRHRCSARLPSSKHNNNNKTKKKKKPSDNLVKDDDLDEDAFEALFNQLEEDLKNDGLSLDDFDEDLSEEDLAKLEIELAEALEDDEMLGSLDVEENDHDDEDGDEDEEEEEEEEAEEVILNLKTWQLRRLAYALKDGKRKTSIKVLAGDVCLDRSLVLKLLRDPPPTLLLMSAALPDKPTPVNSEPGNKTIETISSEIETKDLAKSDPNVKVPVHVIQSNWSAQKRLKKVHLDTLERVYNRTKRPTNAILSSIVHVTNLPRKKVVKWFEDKRAEDGVPDHRHPYQRNIDVAESA